MKKLHTDCLDIGTFIHAQLKDILPTFPIIAEKGSSYPFALYRRTNSYDNTTKDQYIVTDFINMEITICAVSYPDSITLAKAVKNRLEHIRGRYSDKLLIDEITMVGSSEDWADDAYIQHLNFLIKLENI